MHELKYSAFVLTDHDHRLQQTYALKHSHTHQIYARDHAVTHTQTHTHT